MKTLSTATNQIKNSLAETLYYNRETIETLSYKDTGSKH